MRRRGIDPRHSAVQSVNGILVRQPVVSSVYEEPERTTPVLTGIGGGSPSAALAALAGRGGGASRPPARGRERVGEPPAAGGWDAGAHDDLSGWDTSELPREHAPAPAPAPASSRRAAPQSQGRGGPKAAVKVEGAAVCDGIWTSAQTRAVARRLPEIDESVLGFESSESRKLLLRGWEEMLRQEAKLGNAQAVEQLLYEKMFDINGVDEVGVSALHIAAFQGHDDVVAVLCSHSADVNLRCRGETGLSLAVAADRTATVDMLLARGADPSIAGMGGATLLHSCAKTGNAELMETFVVDYSMPLDEVDEDGLMAFHVAVQEGHTKVSDVLLANGQNANAWGGGLTAIHLLACTGDASTAHRYVNHYGLDPNTTLKPEAEKTTNGRLEPGMRALHVAILEDNYTMVQMLAKAGADLHAKDASGKKPMELALLNGKRDIAHVLAEGMARDKLLAEINQAMKSLPDDFFLVSDKLTAKMEEQRQRDKVAAAQGATAPLDRSCAVCSSVTKDSAPCGYCGLVWYCGRAHSQSHREEHRRDCRDCATAQKDAAFQMELAPLLCGSPTEGKVAGTLRDKEGTPRGAEGLLEAFEYDTPAKADAVAALSDWDFFFEKRGLPPAWAKAFGGKPAGEARAAVEAAGLQHEEEELEAMLQRASAGLLSLPLTLLKALQAVNFERHEDLEIHVIAHESAQLDKSALHRQFCQLALLVPSVPKLNVVVVKAQAKAKGGAKQAPAGPSSPTDGGSPTSARRDHSLNFVGLSPGGDEAGSPDSGGMSGETSPTARGGNAKGKKKGKKKPGSERVAFELFGGLYDDYVFAAGRDYTRPTLVVAQHMGLPRPQVPSIVSLLQKEVPILLSFWTQEEEEMISMAMTDNFKAKVVEKGENPFRSLVGQVDKEEVCTYFDNRHTVLLRGFATD